MTFAVTGGKGVHFTFPNGYTVSMQWGPGNYGDNYNASFDTPTGDMRSNTVEVAYWYNHGGLLYMPDIDTLTVREDYPDTVVGYWNITQVMKFLNFVQQLEPGKHPMPSPEQEESNDAT